jgi:CubicO group peptidase (beta-lactamase class C family)
MLLAPSRTALRRATIGAALVVLPGALGAQRGAATYWPDADWERRTPAQVGMSAVRLDSAVAFAIASESQAPRDLEVAHYRSFGREPFGHAVGPFQERGAPTGIVVRHGYVVATWGEPARVDMTFSVTKSFLSTVVGLAWDRGLVRDLDRPVAEDVGPILALGGEAHARAAERLGHSTLLDPFATPHNRRITWEHLLRQTSDWEGTLWGKPDWADRPDRDPATWTSRPRRAPGSAYEYNDVRVNVLALAALGVWRRPLPEVLREEMMDPIGASRTWRWYGYDDSWVLVDGLAMQSVSGGGHWGGGMFISAWDQARFGLLTLRRGRWKDRQLLSEAWVRRALTPTAAQPDYGYMNWFLNTDRKRLPSAPATAFVHLGNGTNAIVVDPDHDLVIVARWIEGRALDGLVRRVIAAVE